MRFRICYGKRKRLSRFAFGFPKSLLISYILVFGFSLEVISTDELIIAEMLGEEYTKCLSTRDWKVVEKIIDKLCETFQKNLTPQFDRAKFIAAIYE